MGAFALQLGLGIIGGGLGLIASRLGNSAVSASSTTLGIVKLGVGVVGGGLAALASPALGLGFGGGLGAEGIRDLLGDSLPGEAASSGASSSAGEGQEDMGAVSPAQLQQRRMAEDPNLLFGAVSGSELGAVTGDELGAVTDYGAVTDGYG